MALKMANKAKTVSAKWVVRIPGDESRVLVKEGDKVKVGQALVEWVKFEKTSLNASSVLKKMKDEQKQELITSLKGKKISEGEVVLKGGGLFPVKIVSGVSGEITDVDDFDNIVIKLTDRIQEDKTVSPVEADVDKIEEDKVVLKFKAVELLGKGSDSGKAWGNSDLKVHKSLFEVKSEMEGKILLTEDVSDIFLLKAEVIGVRGVVVSGKTDENDLRTSLPVVSISNEEMAKLEGLGGEEKEVRVLLNSKVGRVLVVVQ